MSQPLSDVLLDPLTGDLYLSDGDLVLSSGDDSILQAIRSRLQFFAGEWFADLDVGLPAWDQILVKNPNLGAIQQLFRAEILATPGVYSLTELSLDYTPGSRFLTVTFRAVKDTGTELLANGLQIGAP